MYYITLDLEWNQAYAQKALAVQRRLACRLRGAVEISQRALQIGGRAAQCGGRAADRIGNVVELRLELAVEIGFDAVDGGLRLLGKLAHALAVGCGVAHFRVDIVGAGVE